MLFSELGYFQQVSIARTHRRDEVGQHQPTLCQDVGGRLWWAKSAADMLWNGMLAEAVYYGLAPRVQAAVPDGAMAEVPGLGWCWLSRDVGPNTHWEDSAPEPFSNHDAVGASIALDAVLHNEDRHGANVLVAMEGTYERRLWWIDADVAGVSSPAHLLTRGRAAPDPRRKHIRGLPISQVRAGADAAAVELTRLVPEVDEFARACIACARAPEGERVKLAEVLELRMAAAPEIVGNYLDALWSL